MDSALPFVQATYKLEGDGHLAFECYDIISSVSAAVHVAHYPNVEVISQRLAPNNASLKQQLLDYSKQCMQPAYDYYTQHLQSCLNVPLAAFKADQLFVPQKIQQLQPTALTIDSLAVFPFLSDVSTSGAV